MLNWYVNDKGTLEVYVDNVILFEISNCADMNDEEISRLIMDELEEREDNLLLKKLYEKRG